MLCSSLIVPIVPQLTPTWTFFSQHQPGHLQILSKVLIKVAGYWAVQGRFKRNRDRKYLDGSGEIEKRKKKVRKKEG